MCELEKQNKLLESSLTPTGMFALVYLCNDKSFNCPMTTQVAKYKILP